VAASHGILQNVGVIMSHQYVHGYSPREAERLHDQGSTLRELFHHDTFYPPGSRVLEAGCGVGVQTLTLARRSPQARFVSMDISEESLKQAAESIQRHGITNVEFRQGDIYNLPFEPTSFDHVFICHVLEHLSDPVRALQNLRSVLKSAGSITAIEGDHGSCYWHPDTEPARRCWQCLIDAQARLGGDSLIGRRLFPLLAQAGFHDVVVSPRMVYVDHSNPALVDGFIRKTIIAMVEGVEKQSIDMGLIDKSTWDHGIRDLNIVADRPDGTFCYTFFKAVGIK
jgi:SAM-dependent methyltransferase